MNYSPDYSMRRRNQDCGCRRSSLGGPAQMPARRQRPMPVSAAPATPERPLTPEYAEAYQVGMAYVPWQVWRSIYEPSQALMTGTIFQELDYPWMVGGGCGTSCR